MNSHLGGYSDRFNRPNSDLMDGSHCLKSGVWSAMM